MAGNVIAFVVIFLLVAGVGLYLFNSGALTQGIHYLESSIPTSSLAGSSGSGAGAASGTSIGAPLNGVGAEGTPGPGTGVTIISAPPSTTITNPNITPSNIPAGFTMPEISPYFRYVQFAGLSAAPPPMLGSTDYGQITLNAYFPDPSSTIDVTGWEIKTNRSGEYIPQAVAIYDPLGLNPPSDIVMKNGDTLSIYSSSAPVNLRLNECIGYLPNLGQFNPPLPQTCPPIDSSGLGGFSGACQDYILSLNGCQEPDLSSPQIPAYDYACKQYLTGRFNYKWCFDTYFYDPNFFSNQIDVWTGSSPLDQYHDQVELLDRNGLLVDYASY